MINGPKITFSEKALAQLNRSGASASLTTYSTRWTWLFLAAFTLLAGALIAWGFRGSMVESTAGIGVVLGEGGVKPVIAKGSGMISNLNLEVGAQVTRNQILGQIYHPNTFYNLKKQERDYEQLLEQIKQLEAGLKDFSGERLKNEAFQAEHLKTILAEQESARARSREVADMFHQLRDVGVVSKVDYYRTLDQMFQTDFSLMSTLMQARATNLNQKEIEWSKLQTLLDLQKQRFLMEQELELSSKLFRDVYWIRSEINGTVSELLKKPGYYVTPGEKIALVRSDESEGLFVAAYVPVQQGKKIRRGMSAFFAPGDYPAQEYGYVKGVVREVSDAAVSLESIMQELENQEFSRMVSAKSAMMRVVIDLLPDRHTASRLKWTGSNGAPEELDSGTYGAVIVNTEYRTPASYIIPYLRKTVLGVADVPGEADDDRK